MYGIAASASLDDAMPLVTGNRITTSTIPWPADATPAYLKYRGLPHAHMTAHGNGSASGSVIGATHANGNQRSWTQRGIMPALFPLDKANDSQFTAIMLVHYSLFMSCYYLSLHASH
jgi:hypothetical protein